MSLVEVIGLSRSFGATHAVRDVSFAFDAGEVFGFIGPNGAGKTTTMRILAGLDEPTRGDCRIGGLSTVDDADRVARRVGYMPDELGAYPNMTALEYLDFFARAYGLVGARRRAALDDVIDFCQLGGLQDKLVNALSKGMRQRLGLGRTLIHDPDVLILDEPSAGLDPRARVELRALIRLLAKQGKAVLISSHILADLQEICSAVGIIELGRLVATGPVADIRRLAEARARSAAARPSAPGADAGASERPSDRTVVELRLARPVDRLASILAEQPDVADVAIVDDAGELGGAVTLSCPSDPAAQAHLLERLVRAGLPVCHFATRDQSLEDLFMHLTDGHVQ